VEAVMALLGVGFFGEGNLGDEAILEGLLARSRPHAPSP
jgi:polysaccharide pyruvyl transferase WcaK-like protein